VREPPLGMDTSDIRSPIAEDYWTYKENGVTKTSRVAIGAPTPVPGEPQRDWYCPFIIEGRTEGVDWAYGCGPVDALVNAARTIFQFSHEVAEVAPHGGVRGGSESS